MKNPLSPSWAVAQVPSLCPISLTFLSILISWTQLPGGFSLWNRKATDHSTSWLSSSLKCSPCQKYVYSVLSFITLRVLSQVHAVTIFSLGTLPSFLFCDITISGVTFYSLSASSCSSIMILVKHRVLIICLIWSFYQTKPSVSYSFFFPNFCT
jgi:hypothetical protein